jgi:hypothetical protein
MSNYYSQIDNKFDELLSKTKNNNLVLSKQDLIDLKAFIFIAYKNDNYEDVKKIKNSFKKLNFKIPSTNVKGIEFYN